MLKNYEIINGIIQFNRVITEALPRFIFYPSILTEMDDNGQYIWNMNLPKKDKNQKIILHTQDHLNVWDNVVPELEYIENYYKTDLENIVVIHWNHDLNEIYNGKLRLLEFPTHSFDFIQQLSKRKNEWYDAIDNRTNNYDFICLNGKEREFRTTVFNYLKKFNLNSCVTLGLDENSYVGAKYKDYDWDNVNNFVNLLPLFSGSNVNVVTETMYNESHGIISEKSLDPFVALQLPIFISYKGMVADLRDRGFDVFDDVIDHSYDTMDNDIRWKSAIDLNKHILEGKYNYESLLPRLKQNQEYILNGYLDKMITDFLQQVNDTIQ